MRVRFPQAMPKPIMNQVAAVAAVGGIAAFWQQFKEIVSRIISIFIRTDQIETVGNACTLLDIMRPDLKIYHWGNRTFQTESLYEQSLELELSNSFLKSYVCRYKKAIIFLSNSSGKLCITYLMGTFDLDGLMVQVNNTRNQERKTDHDKSKNLRWFSVNEVAGRDTEQSPRSRVRGELNTSAPELSKSFDSGSDNGSFSIFQNIQLFKESGLFYGASWNDFTKPAKPPSKQVVSYYWSAETLKLEEEIEFWLNNKSWYVDRGLAWRRGVLLKGRPGTGKTKMVLKCAEKLKLHTVKMNIGNMSNTEFTEQISENSRSSNPTLVLIEDIDCIFEGRKNKLSDGGGFKQLLSFDTLINCISGIKHNSGLFFVITTNRPEVLDSALIRAGRMDAEIDVGSLAYEGKQLIASNILRDWSELQQILVNDGKEYTAAEFENACVETAINEKNKERVALRKLA